MRSPLPPLASNESEEERRKADAFITLFGWAIALDGLTILLWAYMGIAMLILITVFLAAGGHFRNARDQDPVELKLDRYKVSAISRRFAGSR